MTTDDRKCDVLMVGCGCPLRSMGWYHAEQLLDNRCPSAQLRYVVEPWYMQKAAMNTPGWSEFEAWKERVSKDYGVQFYARVDQVPSIKEDGSELRMGILSARTADNPSLFAQMVSKCHTIYLEKPGAPSVEELVQMRDMAEAANVSVYMGFNKNVAKYSTKTMEYAGDRGQITFVHNNNYQLADLPECFERNAEGMLKNMAIHELALLVTFFGVSVSTIDEVQSDAAKSSCQTLKGPASGKDFTDFDKIYFTITTQNGVKISVFADRCAGDDSVGIIYDENNNVVKQFCMPDEDDVQQSIPALAKKYPGAMPYFYVQDPDYCALKERIAQQCVSGTSPQGVATIDIAIETLKVAEYLTPILQEQLLSEVAI